LARQLARQSAIFVRLIISTHFMRAPVRAEVTYIDGGYS